MGAEGDGLNDRAGGAGKCSPPARQVQVREDTETGCCFIRSGPGDG